MSAARRADQAVRDLYPGYFALVMATGILSDACLLLHHERLSAALLGVNLVAYPTLAFATIARGIRFGRQLWRDLTDPRLVFSFFTIVAATDILGVQLLHRGFYRIAAGLWLFSLAVWVALAYFSFALLIISNDRRGAGVVHGGWLIAIVGTESLVLLGIMLAPEFGRFGATTFVAVHSFWGVGIVFYGIFVTLFSNRLFFFRVEPIDAMPLFWVIMGAAAISANAGGALVLAAPLVPFLAPMRPFLEGTTLILWAWGTWWIPLLVIMGIWKHIVHGIAIVYQPMYWSLVFPLGMYSVASYRLSLATGFPPFAVVAHGMMWVALGAWAITMFGWANGLLRGLRAERAVAS